MPQPALDSASGLLEAQLDEYIGRLETTLDADAMAFSGPIHYGADDIIRDGIEYIQARRAKLVVILETGGGYIEVVQRIADTFRRHYGHVEFIVPNHAMSAGTVLVMSGDAIRMDYYSVLGPIDPQLPKPDGNGFVPALGYLVQYERLIKKSKDGTMTTAELSFLLDKFDPAELYDYEQARELSISLLQEWLVKYKFKNWIKTETRQIDVTPQMRTRRAKKIARALNETDRWHSHGRGISMDVLRRKLKLQIEDFGDSAELNGAIRAYYKLLKDYIGKRGDSGVLHIRGRYKPLVEA
jgi:hypothetical protein